MVNSREKGKEGEREVRNLFRKVLAPWIEDVDAVRRNHQQAEIGGADLVGTPLYCVEVKRVKRLPLTVETKLFQSWWAQAVAQTTRGKSPCLVYREDYGEWYVAVETAMAALAEDNSINVTIFTWEQFIEYYEERLRIHAERLSAH